MLAFRIAPHQLRGERSSHGRHMAIRAGRFVIERELDPAGTGPRRFHQIRSHQIRSSESIQIAISSSTAPEGYCPPRPDRIVCTTGNF